MTATKLAKRIYNTDCVKHIINMKNNYFSRHKAKFTIADKKVYSAITDRRLGKAAERAVCKYWSDIRNLEKSLIDAKLYAPINPHLPYLDYFAVTKSKQFIPIEVKAGRYEWDGDISFCVNEKSDNSLLKGNDIRIIVYCKDGDSRMICILKIEELGKLYNGSSGDRKTYKVPIEWFSITDFDYHNRRLLTR